MCGRSHPVRNSETPCAAETIRFVPKFVNFANKHYTPVEELRLAPCYLSPRVDRIPGAKLFLGTHKTALCVHKTIRDEKVYFGCVFLPFSTDYGVLNDYICILRLSYLELKTALNNLELPLI